jgi:hypothetical protein
MIIRLTSPQKPSEQFALAPIVNPCASAIAATHFRAARQSNHSCQAALRLHPSGVSLRATRPDHPWRVA